MENKIILLTGVRGSGKDHFAQELKSHYESLGYFCPIIGFSDGVRDYCWKALGWVPEDDFEYEKFKGSKISLNVSGKEHSFTGREFLTRIGDDVMKDYDPLVWCNVWGRKFDEVIFYHNVKTVCIVNDLRHREEYFEVKRKGVDSIVYFCDYKSHRYEISDHPTERLANKLRLVGFKDRQDITNEIIKYL